MSPEAEAFVTKNRDILQESGELALCYDKVREMFPEADEIQMQDLALTLRCKGVLEAFGVGEIHGGRKTAALGSEQVEVFLTRMNLLVNQLEQAFMMGKQRVEAFAEASELTAKQRVFLRQEVLTIPFEDAP